MRICVFPQRREMSTYSHFHRQKWVEIALVGLQVSSVIGCHSWKYLLKSSSSVETVFVAILSAPSMRVLLVSFKGDWLQWEDPQALEKGFIMCHTEFITSSGQDGIFSMSRSSWVMVEVL